MTSSPPTPAGAAPVVVVVGAGISGLAAAEALGRERPDAVVVVLEASDRVGGKLRREEVAGLTVDVGAEAMLNRRPEAVALARRAGLGDRLVHPATTEARVWSRGALRRMPRSVMGVPAVPDDLAASGVLSAEGLARALHEPEVTPTVLGTDDVSVGRLVEERFGAEVVDRLVEPLLGGVYAGHARELSARATVPQVVALLDRDPSLLRAAGVSVAAAAPAPGQPAPPVFAGLRGGVGALAEALAAGRDVRLRSTARALERTPSGWRLVVGSAAAPEEVAADAVVVATPAPAAARLLAGVAAPAAAALAEVETASMAVVTMAFPAEAFPEVAGSGFLVPPVEGLAVKAATYSFAKWGWVRASSPDLVVVRTSLGRHRQEQDLQVPDEELVARSVADLGTLVGLEVPPVDWQVQRWGGGLPQYAVGHLDRVRRVRDSVATLPGLAVCGATYDGVGIPACIASAEKAVRQVLDALPEPPL